MKSPFSLLAAAAVCLLPVLTQAADNTPAGTGAASTAQAADFSSVAPARSGDEKQPATNPSPGTLQPQSPQNPSPSRKPGDTEATGDRNRSSASGLTAPGATSGSSLGSGSNSTLKGGDEKAK